MLIYLTVETSLALTTNCPKLHFASSVLRFYGLEIFVVRVCLIDKPHPNLGHQIQVKIVRLIVEILRYTTLLIVFPPPETGVWAHVLEFIAIPGNPSFV